MNLIIAVTLRIGERVHRALQERQVQEDAHENHRGNGHPVERRIDLALGVFRNLLRLLLRRPWSALAEILPVIVVPPLT